MKNFLKCEICDKNSWKEIYKGKIRKGDLNTFEEGAIVKECNYCGVQRLSEFNCLKEKSSKYKLLSTKNLNKHNIFIFKRIYQ